MPAEAIGLLTETVSKVAAPVLLDLGSGTGQVPLALHQAFTEINLVEPDADMLAEAERAVRALSLQAGAVRLHHARAEDFVPPSDEWRADLVTISRAFHWMDQSAVLELLDRCTAPHGVVAVIGDGSLWTARTTWTDALRYLIQDYLGTERRAGQSKTYSAHNRPYAEILGESAFSRVEEHTIEVQREWTPEQVLGYLSSTSFAARDLFGDRLADFEHQALHLLTEHAEPGRLIEPATFTVLLAHRT